MAASELKSKRVLCYDYGLFPELSVTLAKEFGEVFYYVPWKNAFAKSNTLLIGQGVEGITHVASPWEHLDNVDLVVFPDVNDGALQEYLVKQGKRVWGSRLGEELEIDRIATKEISIDLGIDVPDYEVVTGIEDLREYLKRHDDQWVKISATRGDMETFHAIDYDSVETRINELAHTLGAKGKITKFVVEENIPDAIEVGYDGFTVDGRFAKGAIVGVEVKDKAYVGRALRYNDLPPQVRSVNAKLSPALRRYGCRTFMSTEIRCTKDGRAYLIDPCMRAGSPPSEVYPLMIANLAEIVWEGAGGIVIEPEFTANWAAQICLTSDWSLKDWQHVRFPKEIRDHVVLHNMAVIEGETYVVPQTGIDDRVGSVVATGDTAEAAIAECKRLADLVEGYDIEKSVEALDQAHEQLTELLGDKASDKPPSKLERKAQALKQSGRISDKQYEKMMASNQG